MPDFIFEKSELKSRSYNNTVEYTIFILLCINHIPVKFLYSTYLLPQARFPKSALISANSIESASDQSEIGRSYPQYNKQITYKSPNTIQVVIVFRNDK